ncbi:hypothetical protein V3C99_017801 [Haemonchus contortus]
MRLDCEGERRQSESALCAVRAAVQTLFKGRRFRFAHPEATKYCGGILVYIMSRRHRLDDLARERLIGKHGKGRAMHCVAQEAIIARIVVSRAWRAFPTAGAAARRRGDPRPRPATPDDNRYSVQQARGDPR